MEFWTKRAPLDLSASTAPEDGLLERIRRLKHEIVRIEGEVTVREFEYGPQVVLDGGMHEVR